MDRIFLYPYTGPGGRNYLKQIGTTQDLMVRTIQLTEGLTLKFYCDDADEAGNPDPLFFEGTAHFDHDRSEWYIIVNEDSYTHMSGNQNQ